MKIKTNLKIGCESGKMASNDGGNTWYCLPKSDPNDSGT